MKTSTLVGIIVAVLILAGGVYWWMYSTPAAVEEQATTNPAEYIDGNLLLGTDATSTLGTYLIGYNGMTLYRYTQDTPNASHCSGQCAAKWPPYVVASLSALKNTQAGVSGTVGSITRADGSIQVTYNGAPLYFWIQDIQSGDTTGQGVGGVWFVVQP